MTLLWELRKRKFYRNIKWAIWPFKYPIFLNVPLPKKETKAEEDHPDRPSKDGPLLTSVIRHTSCPDHSVTYIVCKL